MGVFGGTLARSSSGDGVNDVVKGVSGKVGGVDSGECWALRIRQK